MVGPFYALCYLLFAAFSAYADRVIAALPPRTDQDRGGPRPDGRLRRRIGSALADEPSASPAVLTLAVTASGSPFGVGSAFWGLVAGLLALGLDCWRRGCAAAAELDAGAP